VINSARRLHLLEYEPEAPGYDDVDREDERDLDDRDVDQLLTATAVLRLQREAPDEGDAIGAMRGLYYGLVVMLPAWGLVLAALLLA
jgi:hypothetical protein